MSRWTCSIQIPGSDPIQGQQTTALYSSGITITTDTNTVDVELATAFITNDFLKGVQLTFLATVNLASVPLALRCGPLLSVSTRSAQTETWFRNALALPDDDGRPSNDVELPVGVLAFTGSSQAASTSSPRVTEILFLAIKPDPFRVPPSIGTDAVTSTATVNHPGAGYDLKALCLSSDLIEQIKTAQSRCPTPEISPRTLNFNHEDRLTFVNLAQLSSPATQTEPHTETQSNPQIAAKKRKTALQAFDIAADRLKRRKADQSQASARYANQIESSGAGFPDPESRRSVSASFPGAATVPSRPVTPGTSFPAATAEKAGSGTTEERNRETISRLVMAGMRIHDVTKDTVPLDEYKLIYHNTFKSVVFSFRRSMARIPLQGLVDEGAQQQLAVLQGRVDVLLGMFCGTAEHERGPGQSGNGDVVDARLFGEENGQSQSQESRSVEVEMM